MKVGLFYGACVVLGFVLGGGIVLAVWTGATALATRWASWWLSRREMTE